MALTYPAIGRNLSPMGAAVSGSSGIYGVLEERNRWTVLAPLGSMLLCNAANWLFLGPTATSVMHERKRQETRDGKKSYDKGEKSDEMQALNKKFGMWHGASALVNLGGLGIAGWYGFLLAERFQ